MLASQATEYGFRALTHLALNPDRSVKVREIAEATSIPPHFLAKIMRRLARYGLLKSYRGPTGGFQLTKRPTETTLLDIVDAIDGLTWYHRCAVGLADCNDDAPCPLHDSWKAVREHLIGYLLEQTLADLAEALRRKQESLKRSRRLTFTPRG